MEIDMYLRALEDYLQQRKTLNERLPGTHGRTHFEPISFATGIPQAALQHAPRLLQRLSSAAEDLKLTSASAEFPLLTVQREAARMTYDTLKTEGMNFMQIKGLSSGSAPSYLSELKGWRRCFQAIETDTVHLHLGTDFSDFLAIYLQATSKTSTAQSRMKRWSQAYQELCRPEDLPESFPDALTELISRSGRNRNSIARALSMEITTLTRWADGSTRPSDPQRIAQLEKELNVLPGVLDRRVHKYHQLRLSSKIIPLSWWPERWQVNISAYRHHKRKVIDKISPDAFTNAESLQAAFSISLQNFLTGASVPSEVTVLKNLRDTAYRYKEDAWSPELSAEWDRLRRYKTAPDGLENEERNSRWTGETPDMAARSLERFFGFLLLPSDEPRPEFQGLGLQIVQLTLAWLVVPEVVKAFLEFNRVRVGLYNRGTVTFVARWGALLRPKTGWLWMHPEFFHRLPPEAQTTITAAGGWQTYCNLSHQSLNQSIVRLKKKGLITVTRNPMDPILPILDHPRPLDLVQQALDAHQKDIHAQFLAEKDLTPRQAAAWRDHLLISMLCRLPLRAKHWGLMSYLQNNTGSLRFHPVDGWLLVVPFDEFKNVRNTKIFNAYGGVRELVLRLSELESFQSLVPTLEFYLETVWSKIPNQSDRLFPSNTGLLLRTPIVTQRVRSWSEFYLSEHAVKGIQIPGVRPFGAHAFRDIVATHIIKTTGSIEMAANILLDDVATVEKHYARFLPENRLTNAMNSFSNVFAPA